MVDIRAGDSLVFSEIGIRVTGILRIQVGGLLSRDIGDVLLVILRNLHIRSRRKL